ncbi:hypothetical protein [Ruminococcus sp.]|uniref:hypothetical protein n=1 Tax=Ruminococcus sp. TaxID=41978 RepID=UPI003FEE8C74
MTTALFLLRCIQIGLSMQDLNELTYGMVLDIFSEHANDSCEYASLATQRDFDTF